MLGWGLYPIVRFRLKMRDILGHILALVFMSKTELLLLKTNVAAPFMVYASKFLTRDHCIEYHFKCFFFSWKTNNSFGKKLFATVVKSPSDSHRYTYTTKTRMTLFLFAIEMNHMGVHNHAIQFCKLHCVLRGFINLTHPHQFAWTGCNLDAVRNPHRIHTEFHTALV